MLARLLFVLFVSAFLAPAFAQAPAAITDIKISGDSQRTEIMLLMSQRVAVTAFTLADPARVIVDLPAVDFKLDPKTGVEAKGMISAFRFGQFASDQSRIVFDIKGTALIGDVQMISTAEGAMHRVVIEILKGTREAQLKQIAERNVRLGKASDSTALKSAGKQDKFPLPVIVIDAGHGGIDSGARAPNGFLEKNLTLAVAKAIRDILEKSGKVKVAMTRDSDVFIPLGQRRAIGQQKNAALFLSIHADSYGRPTPDLRGATVYTLSEKATDKEAEAYAERENRADMVAGVEKQADVNEVADILYDLMSRETKAFSLGFSRILTDELKDVMRLNRNPRRAAAFVVLKAPDVPSALLELGYLSNASDARLMQTEEWRKTTAKSVAEAILSYLQQSGVRGKPVTP